MSERVGGTTNAAAAEAARRAAILRAAQEAARRAAEEAQRAAQAAAEGRGSINAAEHAAQQARTIDQADHAEIAQAAGVTEDEVAATLADFETDGNDGLDEAELDAGLASVEEEMAVAEMAAPEFGVLSQGSAGEEVSELQEQLVGAGADPGPVDGQYGPNTDAAVRQYQEANNLPVDGDAGPQTRSALLIDNTTIDPEKPDVSNSSVNAAEHRIESARAEDQAKVDEARAALENLPPEAREAYAAKVDELQRQVDEKWAAEPPQETDEAQETQEAQETEETQETQETEEPELTPEQAAEQAVAEAEEVVAEDRIPSGAGTSAVQGQRSGDEQRLADAQTAIEALPEGEDRDALQARLDAAQEQHNENYGIEGAGGSAAAGNEENRVSNENLRHDLERLEGLTPGSDAYNEARGEALRHVETPEDLHAVANVLEQADPEDPAIGVLRQTANSGDLSREVVVKIGHALLDTSRTNQDFQEMVTHADSPEELEAVAVVAAFKATEASGESEEDRARYAQLAEITEQLAGLDPESEFAQVAKDAIVRGLINPTYLLELAGEDPENLQLVQQINAYSGY